VAALASLESSARATLASLAAEREAYLLLALQFLSTCTSAARHAERRCASMQAERHRAELALIAAETEASSLQENAHRVEETRRFLVNRVKCAQWSGLAQQNNAAAHH
jgi:chlorite dismutase